MGLGHLVGSIEVGKRADLVLLDTTGDHWRPQADIAEAVVWQSQVSDVRTVLVDGRAVVEDGWCTGLEPDRVAAAGKARAACC